MSDKTKKLLRQKRLRLYDLGVTEIANLVGVNVASLHQILNGKNCSESTIVKIANSIGCSRLYAYAQIEKARELNSKKRNNEDHQGRN